jgi:hypothetical protein
MLAIWILSLALMVVMFLYTARLGRNEEDQLFLAASSNRAKSEQDAIALRVERVMPFKKMSIMIAGATTLCVALYFGMGIIRQFI